MNETFLGRTSRRVAAWIEAVYVDSCADSTPNGVLEASRWGWLPALSGVAVAADGAAAAHSEANNTLE